MKKKIYLAGAMGCYGKDGIYPKQWRKLATEYLGDYFKIIDPTYYYNYGYDEHKTEKEIMRFDMRKVVESDVVLCNLKDLDKSLGTSDEILLSYLNGIPVVAFLEPMGQEKIQLHPWKEEQIDRIEIGNNALLNACDYIFNYYS